MLKRKPPFFMDFLLRLIEEEEEKQGERIKEDLNSQGEMRRQRRRKELKC